MGEGVSAHDVKKKLKSLSDFFTFSHSNHSGEGHFPFFQSLLIELKTVKTYLSKIWRKVDLTIKRDGQRVEFQTS